MGAAWDEYNSLSLVNNVLVDLNIKYNVSDNIVPTDIDIVSD